MLAIYIGAKAHEIGGALYPISEDAFFAETCPNGFPDFVIEFALTWINGLNAGE